MRKNADIFEYMACIFFPNRCIFCGEILPPNEESLCDRCREGLPFIKGEICYNCGADCENCSCGKKHGDFFDKSVSSFYYIDDVQECIHRFKFRSDKRAGIELARLMSETCRQRYPDVKFDYVAYVPMDKKRQRIRGYNQSRLLAEYIADECRIPFGDNLITKIYPTEVQHLRSETERKGNLLGAFDINKKYNIDGKTILLVDDVKTSGSTLSECGKMLYLYGAENVFCLTTALVNSKMNDSE